MNSNAYTLIADLLDEVALSFATLDEDTPRERVAICPRCGDPVLVAKNQQVNQWEVNCCRHTERSKDRSRLLQKWDRWASA